MASWPVRNSCVTKDRLAAGFWDATKWEEVKLKSDDKIKAWIDEQMTGTSVTVVLIGGATASRKYVAYEIQRSIELRKGLLGVRIHALKSPKEGLAGETEVDNAGENPLLEEYPVYDWVKDDGRANLGQWIEDAAEAAGR